MAREIKFRGKSLKDGEWIYGMPIHDTRCGEDTWYICTCWRMTRSIATEVNPDTIGQYTGFKAKHGKEIYEGDILRVTRLEHGPHYENVVYTTKVREYGWIDYDSHYSNLIFIGDADDCEFEVIGTIFDNPELLQQSLNTSDPTC